MTVCRDLGSREDRRTCQRCDRHGQDDNPDHSGATNWGGCWLNRPQAEAIQSLCRIVISWTTAPCA
jgi:hypothetical protein